VQDRPTLAELAAALGELVAGPLAAAAGDGERSALLAAARSCDRLGDGDLPDPRQAGEALGVREVLEGQLSSCPPELRFSVQVGIHVAGILERELRAGPAPVLDEGRRLSTMGLALGIAPPATAAGVRAVQAEVARAIRSGAADVALPQVSDALLVGLRERLRIARPGWEEFADDGRG
jgi:hypothetical protein